MKSQFLFSPVNCANFISYDDDPWHEKFAKQSNFCVKINGDVYSFVYARKFACTTLKSLVKELHGDIDFFKYCYQNRYHNCIGDVHARIFFYRDPLERVVSCFFNKFIVKSGARDIIPKVENALGGKIDDFTFKQIVEDYLTLLPHKDKRQLVDVHLYPLSFHLLPINYTHAVNISTLFDAMNELLGLEIASTVFQVPRNKSISTGSKDASNGSDWTEIAIGELINEKDNFTYGSFRRCLMANKSLNSLVKNIYSLDYTIIGAVQGQ